MRSSVKVFLSWLVLSTSPEVLSRMRVSICLWIVSKIKASTDRSGLAVVTFSTGLHLRTTVEEMSEE